MELMYTQEFHILGSSVDRYGRLKESMLLYYIQEVAGIHGSALGASFEALAARNLFWAIIRQKVQITRLPMAGETIRLETWAMPATRTYYPRSTVAYDAAGNEIFRAIGMWVLMDVNTRAMVLPGKSDVHVEGLLTGTELKAPGSLAPKSLLNAAVRRVGYTDLDRNGHMNNTRCLEWINDLLPSHFHKEHIPAEFTVCYHSEAREGDELQLHWQVLEGDTLLVDAFRPEADNRFQRIFTAQIKYGE
ncbi:MAG: hypothetical protein IJZ39_11900 [Oscillospiraceae bacterium]|nr:hypothetical protein [Oscillospiraceae bacterium]